MAADLSQDCADIAEAYSWRISQMKEKSVATQDPYISLLPPSCKVLVAPTDQPTPAKPKCSFKADFVTAWKYPIPGPTDVATTIPPDSSSIEILPRTTRISSYLYYIIEDATIYTYLGRASQIGSDWSGKPVYNILTSLPKAVYSTVSEFPVLESDKQQDNNNNNTFNPDFIIQDLVNDNTTMKYDSILSIIPSIPKEQSILPRTSVTSTIGIPLSEFAAQNGVGEDCEWIVEDGSGTTVVPVDVAILTARTKKYPVVPSFTQGGTSTAVQAESTVSAEGIPVTTSSS
jgi:hypothetical protein